MQDADYKASPKPVDSERQEHQIVDYALMARSEGILDFHKMLMLLYDILREGVGVNGAEYEGLSLREEIVLRIMVRQGLLNLRSSRQGYEAGNIKRDS